jgi:thioester reductase-like protein
VSCCEPFCYVDHSSSRATVVFGPAQLPPSGYLLSEILRHQHVRAFYVPPFILEQWSKEPGASEQAKHLDFVLFGGGPLSPDIGNKLSQVTNVCQMYGSLEVGQVQLLVPQSGEWSYMELNPFEEADMQPIGDGTFEMVLHQDPKFATRRSLWHNFPDIKSWRTGDLFLPHPSKPGLWRFHSRKDDIVVLSSSHKIRPLEMETIIQGHLLLSGALVVGQGKPEPLLIVEPKPNIYDGNSEALIDQIWPSVREANAIAPTYARIMRSKLLVAPPERPFIRAPKGSIVRKLTIQAYAVEIEAAYADDDSSHVKSKKPAGPVIDDFILLGLKQYVRKYVEEYLPDVSLSDTDNIFLRGLDSLGAAGLSTSLQVGLVSRMESSPTMGSLRMIYEYPTIEGLASVLLKVAFGRSKLELPHNHDAKSMEQAVEDFTENLPPRAISATVSPVSTGIRVVLIGPRGSLGPNIVKELMLNPRVTKLYCLNRGEDGRERMRAIFKDRQLPCDVDDERLCFMPITLGKPKLGLSDAHHAELLGNARIVIHNAWKVDFNWTLDLYKVEHLHSIRELVNFSALSPLKPRIVFVSSISSVQDWASVYPTPVTEKPLESYDVASPLGYGQSKHVSERVLVKASAVSDIPVTILRLGQVAGPTTVTGGKWSTDEWVASLAAISKMLKLIPTDISSIDWVPVDLMACVICELTLFEGKNDASIHLEDAGEETNRLRIFNVVNPHLSEWTTFVEVLRKRLGVTAKLVVLTEWVDRLIRTDPESMSDAEASLSLKILPFFQHLADMTARGVALQPKFETSNGVEASLTMAAMRAIDEDLIDLWCQQWHI